MDRLMRELVNETKEEDIADRYRPIVDIIGVDAFVELSIYACGDELYSRSRRTSWHRPGTGGSKRNTMVTI